MTTKNPPTVDIDGFRMAYIHGRHMLVTNVDAGGPGVIRVNDVIISINGQTEWSLARKEWRSSGPQTFRVLRAGAPDIITLTCGIRPERDGDSEAATELTHRWTWDRIQDTLSFFIDGHIAVSKSPSFASWRRLLRQRSILANHLRDALRDSRALRAELDESQSRAAATALRLGNEIAENSTDIDVLRNHIAAVTADRNALRERLDEAHRTTDRLTARLSKQGRTRRVTHIKLGNELFLNRTGARA